MNNWNLPKSINIRQNLKKQTWNERYGKHNWNKDNFRVYLGCHLKEVAISLDPYSNFFQTTWTKNKTDIEN
jgi:hypothetical protein